MRTAPFIRFFRTEQCAYHPSVTLDYLGGVNNRKFKQHCATKLLDGAASASVRKPETNSTRERKCNFKFGNQGREQGVWENPGAQLS